MFSEMGSMRIFEKSETNRSQQYFDWQFLGCSNFSIFLRMPNIIEAPVVFLYTRLPPYFSGFRHLVTCSLSFIYTNDDILDHLVSKCPLLENLTVQHCTGLRNVKIFAVNLKCLEFTGFECESSVTVNCPKLVNFIVHDCPRMSMLELKSCGSLHLSTTELNVLKGLSTKVSNFDKKEIALLGCLFKSAPLLQTMTLTLPRCSQYTHEQSFLKQLLGLKRPCEASVYIAEKYEDYCQRCKRCLISNR
jgi:hypothetical protein